MFTERKPCELQDAENPMGLEYCDFVSDAEYVSKYSKREIVSIEDEKTGLQKKVEKRVVRFKVRSPEGPSWDMSEEEAKGYVLVYNPSNHRCWPVKRELFSENYVTKLKSEKKDSKKKKSEKKDSKPHV